MEHYLKKKKPHIKFELTLYDCIIAAAPEMYELLKKIANSTDNYESDYEEGEDMREALRTRRLLREATWRFHRDEAKRIIKKVRGDD